MLYGKYLKIQLKSAMEYRVTLLFDTISSMLYTVAAFFGVYLLFQQFEMVGGYTFSDVMVTYSIICLAHAVSDCIFRGFDQFDKLVSTGELDRLLIRPRSIFLQVLGYKTELTRIGRMLFCLAVLIVGLIIAPIEWTFLKVLTVIFMIIGACVIYLALVLVYAGLCIFTVEGLEVVNIFTSGGRELSQYPLDIYHKFFKVVFTFVIPFGLVNYLPLRFLLGYTTNIFYAFVPLFTIIFFIICYIFFRWSLTKYKSTGS